jgi:hypothetical protein
MPTAPPDLQKLLLVLAAPCLMVTPAAAQTTTSQLMEFRQEAQAFNRQDPMANAYRAGRYNGYLAGVLDALQGRTVCFKECVCELDKSVASYVEEHGDAEDRPAIDWLVPLLETRFPCK